PSAVLAALPPECTEYKKAVDKLDSCNKMTAEMREPMQKAYAQAQAGWAKLPADSRASLKPSCKMAVDAVMAFGKSKCGWERVRLAWLIIAVGCGRGPDQATRCRAAAAQGVDAMVARAKERISTSGIAPDVRAKIEHNMLQMDAVAPPLRAVIEKRCSQD